MDGIDYLKRLTLKKQWSPCGFLNWRQHQSSSDSSTDVDGLHPSQVCLPDSNCTIIAPYAITCTEYIPLSSMFSSFFPLDELFQIIYQGFYKFVLSTKTKHDAWAVHVAMIDDDATIFWYGSWDADTVAKQTVGSIAPSSSSSTPSSRPWQN